MQRVEVINPHWSRQHATCGDGFAIQLSPLKPKSRERLIFLPLSVQQCVTEKPVSRAHHFFGIHN